MRRSVRGHRSQRHFLESGGLAVDAFWAESVIEYPWGHSCSLIWGFTHSPAHLPFFPASSQRFDQSNDCHQLLSAQPCSGSFESQSGVLCGGHFEVC